MLNYGRHSSSGPSGSPVPCTRRRGRLACRCPGRRCGRVLAVVHVTAGQLPDPAVHDEPVPPHQQHPLARIIQHHRHRAAPHPEDVPREPNVVRKLDIGQAHTDVGGVIHQPLAVDHPLVRVSPRTRHYRPAQASQHRRARRPGGTRRRRFIRAAARTRSPSARRAAASPTWRPAPPPAQAPGHLPRHHQMAAALGPQGPCDPCLNPDHAVSGPDRDRDHLAGSARTAVPDTVAESSLTSKTAASPHGCPGPGTPPTNARATRARSARPVSVTVSRTATPVISAPPPRPPSSRGTTRAARRAHRDARPTRRPTSSRDTPLARARPWPSVESRRLHRPSRQSGRRPLCVRGCRNIGVHAASSAAGADTSTGRR